MRFRQKIGTAVGKIEILDIDLESRLFLRPDLVSLLLVAVFRPLISVFLMLRNGVTSNEKY